VGKIVLIFLARPGWHPLKVEVVVIASLEVVIEWLEVDGVIPCFSGDAASLDRAIEAACVVSFVTDEAVEVGDASAVSRTNDEERVG
jgi:hypothetical protein